MPENGVAGSRNRKGLQTEELEKTFFHGQQNERKHHRIAKTGAQKRKD